MRIRRSLPIILLFLAACRTTLPPVAPHREFRVIGYVRGRADSSAIGAKKLTHLNYAFAKVNPLGVIWFEDPDAPASIAQLQALKAKNPDLKVIVSVGGWGADFFSDAALDDASRCRFADSAIDMIKRYALDGIDLDWEYPGQPGPGIRFRPEDKHSRADTSADGTKPHARRISGTATRAASSRTTTRSRSPKKRASSGATISAD